MSSGDEPFGFGPGADLAGEVVACAQRTLSAASARVQWRQEFNFPPRSRRRRRQGGLIAPVATLARHTVRAGFKRATGGAGFGHLTAEGIIEPASGRYMIDYGAFAEIQHGRETYGGRSGRRLTTLGPRVRGGAADMLWILRALIGTTNAVREGDDVLHGVRCDRLEVRIDLARASAASPEPLRVPEAESFDALSALPATVWTDGDYIRRIHIRELELRDYTLELWDYGVSTGQLDWTRLPAFRSQTA
jgi:hypothetical protein